MQRVTQPRHGAKIKAAVFLDNYVYFVATQDGVWEWVSKRTVSRIAEEQGYGIK